MQRNSSQLLVRSIKVFSPAIAAAIFFLLGFTLRGDSLPHASLTNPLGLVTSIISWDGWSNWQGIFLFLVPFMFTALPVTRRAERRMFTFMLCIVLIPILANITWLLVRPKLEVYGQSGITYAVIGFAFSSSVGYILHLKKDGVRNWQFLIGLFAAITVVSTFTVLFLEGGASFLSAGTGNAFVHFVSFILAMTVALAESFTSNSTGGTNVQIRIDEESVREQTRP